MTEGYKQPFAQRYKNMIAEPKCEEFLKNIEMPWMRFCFDISQTMILQSLFFALINSFFLFKFSLFLDNK